MMLVVMASRTAHAQPNYGRAEQFLTWNELRLVYGEYIVPSWMKDETRFWYRVTTPHGADFILVDPTAAAEEIAFELRDAGVGAVFTVASLSARLPAGTVHVLLDHAPSSATVVDSVGASMRVDLGSHFGLSLEGESDVPGRDEECLVVYEADAAGVSRRRHCEEPDGMLAMKQSRSPPQLESC